MRFMLGLTLLALASCARSAGSSPDAMRSAVRLEASHACSVDCDHWVVDGAWRQEAGHRHGGCDHRFVHGRWVGTTSVKDSSANGRRRHKD